MTFWDHLDVLRSSLIRMGVAVVVFAVAAFMMKETLFSVAPDEHWPDGAVYDSHADGVVCGSAVGFTLYII